MNQYHNFNPDEKRMALAALLQNPEQMPQDTFKMPGTPASNMGMGLMDMVKMMKPKSGGQYTGPTLNPAISVIE